MFSTTSLFSIEQSLFFLVTVFFGAQDYTVQGSDANQASCNRSKTLCVHACADQRHVFGESLSRKIIFSQKLFLLFFSPFVEQPRSFLNNLSVVSSFIFSSLSSLDPGLFSLAKNFFLKERTIFKLHCCPLIHILFSFFSWPRSLFSRKELFF